MHSEYGGYDFLQGVGGEGVDTGKVHDDHVLVALQLPFFFLLEISALKSSGVMEAAEAAVRAAHSTKTVPMHTFSGPVEHALAHIEEAALLERVLGY